MTVFAFLQADSETGLSMDLLTGVGVVAGLRALVMVLLGLPIVYFGSKWARRWATAQVSPQAGLVSGKLIFYVGLATLTISTMTELGFSLTPLLGAAGVVGIAIGFASQTSVSNIIAGLFLITESPFVVNDLIQVGDVVGRVLSVDTMSVKIRTLDNKFVRIPNETLVKSTMTNITRFPIRRLDVRVGVAYKESPERVRSVLLGLADENPMSLMEPPPAVVFEGFGDSSVDFLFVVWTTQENWLALKNSIQEEVKRRFDAEGIEIPFPHRSLYVGSETGAFPVRLVDDPPAGAAGTDSRPSAGTTQQG
jgi:small-conductance mechanosensitive channel